MNGAKLLQMKNIINYKISMKLQFIKMFTIFWYFAHLNIDNNIKIKGDIMSNKLIDNKEVMKEWDYEKNKQLGITPETITNCRRDKVWWICKNGH